jgi:hypothetical protein
MNALVTRMTVEQEILEAKAYGEPLGWQFSDIEIDRCVFTVRLHSSIDDQEYLVEFQYDDYPEKPYLIDFIHSRSNLKGQSSCYPKGKTDSFFHPQGLICHPCSRKAYTGYNNVHADWGMAGWQQIAGGLTSLKNVLDAIYTRITDKTLYDGRMA